MFSVVFAGQIFGFWGDKGDMPPKFKNQGRNSLVMAFVRISIFVFEKFPQEVTFCETTKSAFLSTETSTYICTTRIYIYIYIYICIYLYIYIETFLGVIV